jgi:hypothetical protein
MMRDWLAMFERRVAELAAEIQGDGKRHDETPTSP